jgi:AcrR family transcriptional regulator
MRDRRDNQKKRFLETLAEQGTVSCAAQAAGVSRMTAYRWRDSDREFAALWDEAMEVAIDAVESALYQKARSGETIPMIFYLKAHRPIYRDRLTINLPQLQNEVEERLARLQERLPSSSTAELIKDVLLPGR